LADQRRRIEWFRAVAVEQILQFLALFAIRGIVGERDDRNAVPLRVDQQTPRQGQSIDAGKLQVRENEIGAPGVQSGIHHLGFAGDLDGISGARERGLHGAKALRVVVDD
jgi:hypothetical protein